MEPIYFDNAATTPLDPVVLDAMMPFLSGNFANANSAHQKGREAKVAVEQARDKIADLIGADPSEIIFTSGGTESDNAIIQGVFACNQRKGRNRIISSPLEHHAVSHTIECTKLQGGEPLYLSPDQEGNITPVQVANAIDSQTCLVTLMQVNNEIGTICPIQEIATICHDHGVPFFSDAVQSFGKLPLHAHDSEADFLSMSAHKIYGPKGIGFMYIRQNSTWMPWIHGGSQERRRRGGTLNVPGIVGMAKALELAVQNMLDFQSHSVQLRKSLLQKLDAAIPGQYQINGPQTDGVPHIVNLSFFSKDKKGVDGEMLLLNLDIENICVSNGSACTSGAVEPSHVLLGIGLSPEIANSSIRVSFGKHNTLEEVDQFVGKLIPVLNRMTGQKK